MKKAFLGKWAQLSKSTKGDSGEPQKKFRKYKVVNKTNPQVQEAWKEE